MRAKAIKPELGVPKMECEDAHVDMRIEFQHAAQWGMSQGNAPLLAEDTTVHECKSPLQAAYAGQHDIEAVQEHSRVRANDAEAKGGKTRRGDPCRPAARSATAQK